MTTETVEASAQEATASAGGDTTAASAAAQTAAEEAGKDKAQAVATEDSLLNDGAAGDAADDGEGKKPDEAGKTTPESYGDFTVPEGITVNEPLLAEFKTEAAGMNLTKEQAQKLVDLQVKNVQAQVQRWGEVRKGWVEELKADKDFGGEKFDSSVQDAKMALRQFDTTGEFLKALQASMYDNHPATIKFLATVRRAFGEDAVHTSRDQATKDKLPLAERLYKDADFGGK